MSNGGLTCMVLITSNLCLFYACFSDLSAVEKAPGSSLFDQKASATGFEQQKQQPVKVVYYRALYPFDARSHDEISIQPGDVIMVRNLTNGMLVGNDQEAVDLGASTSVPF